VGGFTRHFRYTTDAGICCISASVIQWKGAAAAKTGFETVRKHDTVAHHGEKNVLSQDHTAFGETFVCHCHPAKLVDEVHAYRGRYDIAIEMDLVQNSATSSTSTGADTPTKMYKMIVRYSQLMLSRVPPLKH
jgi:hypothetical protein